MRSVPANMSHLSQRLLKAAGFTACFLAVFFMSGGHWVALQTFAWGRMIVVYAQRSSLLTAVAQTFDGRHPCKLCCKIREAQEPANQEAPVEAAGRPIEMFFEAGRAAAPPVPAAARPSAAVGDDSYEERAIPPPTPPPKLA
jgi:hypothetical protein